jgi:hypothetical protein
MKTKKLSYFLDELLKGKEIDVGREAGKSEKWHGQPAPIHRRSAL